MTEEERVEKINNKSAEHLQDWLTQLENSEVTETDLLSSLYAAMVTAYLYGYSPDVMAADAKAAAARLMTLVEETENSLPATKTCKNVDENGNCPLHNLHCEYPDCEK